MGITRARQKFWPDSPWVFSRRGKQIKSFRGAWDAARKRAGVPELLLHDLRRTVVRNMARGGVSQPTRMKISGHKTALMERRYNIVDMEDLIRAKALMEQRATKVTAIATADSKTLGKLHKSAGFHFSLCVDSFSRLSA